MVNLKSFHVIDLNDIKGKIFIAGVGSLGSQIVERLTRLNLSSKIVMYDADVVEEINLNNQAYFQGHIGMSKVHAMKDLCKMIDPDTKIKAVRKEITELRPFDRDIVILAIDNYEARGKILQSFKTNPLIISGGISSIGGNFEVVRGRKATEHLAESYLMLESGMEYDENDLTPCGSPISIYHRIGFAASLICDAVIKHHATDEELNYNVMFDTPNLITMKNEIEHETIETFSL